jgi:hypothetical protein
MIEVIDRLIGKVYCPRIYGKSVNIASLVGAKRDFIPGHIPQTSRLMVQSVGAALERLQTAVSWHKDLDLTMF